MWRGDLLSIEPYEQGQGRARPGASHPSSVKAAARAGTCQRAVSEEAPSCSNFKVKASRRKKLSFAASWRALDVGSLSYDSPGSATEFFPPRSEDVFCSFLCSVLQFSAAYRTTNFSLDGVWCVHKQAPGELTVSAPCIYGRTAGKSSWTLIAPRAIARKKRDFSSRFCRNPFRGYTRRQRR